MPQILQSLGLYGAQYNKQANDYISAHRGTGNSGGDGGGGGVIIIINPIITFVTMGILTEINVTWITHERFSMITFLGAFLVIIGAILVARKTKAK